VDPTGLKSYGEGEGKVRQHGAGKRRAWCKVHLAVDGPVKEVIGVEVTTADWADGEVFESRVEHLDGEMEQIDAEALMTPAPRLCSCGGAGSQAGRAAATTPGLGKQALRGTRCGRRWLSGA
jgi:hypothetical protein